MLMHAIFERHEAVHHLPPPCALRGPGLAATTAKPWRATTIRAPPGRTGRRTSAERATHAAHSRVHGLICASASASKSVGGARPAAPAVFGGVKAVGTVPIGLAGCQRAATLKPFPIRPTCGRCSVRAGDRG